MRVADLVLPGCLCAGSVAMCIPSAHLVMRRGRWWLFAVLTVAFLSQIVLLRFFWQLFPADVGYLLLAATCVAMPWTRSVPLRMLAMLGLGLGMISVVLALVLPVFSLPRPTGPYAVGTRVVHLIDASRSDPAFASGHREFMVQVWYPAEAGNEPRAPYRQWKDTTLLSSYDAFLKTHARVNAAIAQSGRPFPVLLFNPAWGGMRTQNTYQTEDLASHGYVVIAIDHTHNAARVAFPDGQVIRATKRPSIDDFRHATFEQQMGAAQQELDMQVKDDIVVLNAFAAENGDAHGSWYHVLDIQRVAAFGHSFGGAVAVEACFRDSRIRAALNMDGWMYGMIGKKILRKPLFVMYESGWPPDAKQLKTEEASTSPADRMDVWDLRNLQRTLVGYGGYVLTIEGTRHMNFSDRSLYSPIRSLTDSGPIDAGLAHQIIEAYTLAFFNHTLRGKDEPLLNETDHAYSVARMATWPEAAPQARMTGASAGN